MYKFASVAALCALSLPLAAQDRITRPVDVNRRIAVPGQVSRQLRLASDLGPLDQAAAIQYATVMLRLSPQVDSFLADLQSPSSPNYHRWLTPRQFGERFGASANDIAKIAAWLKSEGLTVHDVAEGRHWISFSGTAGQVEQAFATQLHRYSLNGETHFANATDPTVPEAIAPLVADVDGLHDFVAQPMHVRAPPLHDYDPDYNLGNAHYLGPDDLATIYNIAPLYRQGLDGTGQKIVVLGQTEILVSDLRSFRNRFGLPANDPQQMLFGPSPGVIGDLIEADLDLQWVGAVARNATIIYAYSRDVFLSAKYAVDNNLAPVMSMSYGQCELFASLGLRGVAQQASAQGITWMISSGDTGAATCDRTLAQTPQATLGATVSFPASLPEVTAVGGTEFNEGSGAFWSPNNDAGNASVFSYIPEIPWNNSAARNALVGGGGGSSANYAKPFWQTGPGVPDNQARNLPDVSLSASSDHDAYFITYLGSGIAIGGTSASAPAFAGIVVLLNQFLKTQGLGNINPTLYRMAQSTPSAFHDITTGDIMMPCAQSSPGCVNGQVGFRAGPGYDRAVGLGSVDAFELVTKWKPGAASTMAVTLDLANPNPTDMIQLTATISPAASGSTAGTPGGTVTFVANDITLATATLAGGKATATVLASQAAAAPNSMVEALYSGDAQFAPSGGAATVNLLVAPNAAFIVVSVSPTPAVQSGPSWPLFITLTEKAGVAATLTRFTFNGAALPLPGGFPSTSIPANGAISARLAFGGFIPPETGALHFQGIDVNGNSWSQDLTVTFNAAETPPLVSAVTLTPTPALVSANPDPQAACRWTQELVVEERAGILTTLATFRVAGIDMSSKIQSIFGTTRLAPFGTLRGTMCFDPSAQSGNITYSLAGVALGTVTAAATATLSSAPAAGTPISVSPQSVSLSAADATQSPGATLTVGLTGNWTASITPTRATWLKLGAATGSGAGTISIQTSAAGLSPGVYDAVVTILASSSNPPSINVPVTLVVGASSAIAIGGIANGASFKTTFAPGMLASVFGTGLAGATLSAPRLPLPIALGGVSATVNGITAPLYFVSPGQINLQIPYETSVGKAVLGINNNGKVASFTFEVGVAAPGIFASGDIALVPAASGKVGDTLLAFITGDGDLTPTLPTGATPPSTTTVSRLPKSRLPVGLTIGGTAATIVFSGIPSGLAGVTQINFIIAPDTPTGVQPLAVNVGGVISPPVNITIAAAAK